MGGSSKKVTVGYRYYVGMHMVLCHGPIDAITQITVDGREAWAGNGRGGQISISNNGLFGGESREGGVSGNVDIEMGGPSQGVNSYLASRISGLIPAFRGVCGLVLRQVYVGLNPYLKKWAFRAKRTQVRQNGIPQWYLPKCEIVNLEISTKVLNENFSSGISNWYLESGSASSFNADSGSLRITGVAGQPISRLSKNISPPSNWNLVRLRFMVQSYDIEDAGVFDLYDANNNLIFNFTPVRDASVDSLRRAHLSFFSGQSGLILSDSILQTGVWYELFLQFDRGSGALSGAIVVVATGEFVKVAQGVSIFSYGPVAKATFRNETVSANGGVSYWDDVEIVEGLSADMNPAHIIRECLTDPDWGMGYAESDIDETSFIAAADKLYVEGLGISLLWDKQTSIEDFVKEIVKHIDAALYVDRYSGKFVLKLIRFDYDEASLLNLNEYNIDKVSDFSRPAFGELTNSISVNFWDSQTNTEASVTLQDIALAQMQGVTINTTVQYPGFTNRLVASKIAQRDLKTLATPLISCTIYANTDARSLNIGDVFKLTWPDYDVFGVVMRVTGVAYGDGRSNRVRINCTQDVFNTPDSVIIVPPAPDWEDPNSPPLAIYNRIVFEVPYLELVQQYGQTTVDQEIAANVDIGYVGAAALRPQSNAINARIFTNSGNGYEDSSSLDFCPGAVLSQNVGKTDTTFSIENVSEISNIAIGTWCQIDEEIMSVEAVSDTEITVKRGVLDTVPSLHFASANIYFWDTYGQGSATEYVRSDEIAVKLLTNTGGGQLQLMDAPEDLLEIKGRAAKPYPPANLKVNGLYYPDDYQISTTAVFTWNDRDRTQQTGLSLIGEGDGDIGPESGTSYEVSISLILADDSTLENWLVVNVGTSKTYTFDQAATPPATGAVKMILAVSSIRDTIRSWQSPSVAVNLLGAPYNVSATYVPLSSPFGLTVELF